MHCETVHAHLADFLSHALTDAESDEIRLHLDGCPACRAEADDFADTWRMLGTIRSPAADSARMRARLTAQGAESRTSTPA